MSGKRASAAFYYYFFFNSLNMPKEQMEEQLPGTPFVACYVIEDDLGLQIRPDYDTDVLWKPPRLSSRSRTISTDSQDSDDAGRRMSFGEDGPGGRKMSLTERIFGRWGTSTTMANQPSTSLPTQPGATPSVMNDERFAELLHHQKKIMGDDMGGLGGFHRSDYVKPK